MMKGIVFIIALCLAARSGQGLECYTCISSAYGWDSDCETAGNTTNLPAVECPDTMNYCSYIRTQWNNISGANSVLRTCTQEPLYLRNGQQDLEGGNLTIWYKSCTMDLCNDANSLVSKDRGLLLLVSSLMTFVISFLFK